MMSDVWSELSRHRRLYPKDEGMRQKVGSNVDCSSREHFAKNYTPHS